MEKKNNSGQECIPVGCVPPARRPYLPGPGGVYLVRGVPGLGGCTWSWGGCTWSQGCVPGPGDVPGPGGVYLVCGGVPGPWGVYLVPGGCTWSQEGGVPGQVLLPPVNRITHTCKNITLPQLRCGR